MAAIKTLGLYKPHLHNFIEACTDDPGVEHLPSGIGASTCTCVVVGIESTMTLISALISLAWRFGQDVLSGFLLPISLNASPHFGHLITCDARRTSSFG